MGMDPALLQLYLASAAKRGQDWATTPAALYMLRFSAESFGVAGDAHELADYGWTTTTLTLADGSGADVPDAGWGTLDWGTPGSCTLGDTTDLLQSPAIFADPMGFLTAGFCLSGPSGRPPRSFVARIWAAFTTDSNNQNRTCFGLFEAGGNPSVAADAFAMIFSDGANLAIRSGAAAGSAVGPAVAQQLLCHEIEIDRLAQLIYWRTSTDGITFTQRATLAIEADLLPVGFGASCITNNVLVLYGDAFFYYK